MIVDVIEKNKCYHNLVEGLDAAFEYLQSHNLKDLPAGKHEVDGGNVFALVQDYETKPADECFFERHEKYIDVQYVVYGSELIGYAPLLEQEVVEEFNKEHDYGLHKGAASFVKVDAGMFAIFFPGDLHMPGTAAKAAKVRKIVVKVKI